MIRQILKMVCDKCLLAVRFIEPGWSNPANIEMTRRKATQAGWLVEPAADGTELCPDCLREAQGRLL